MGTLRGMAFGLAESVHRSMRERQIDFQRRDVGVCDREAKPLKQVFRDSVVSLVFEKARLTPRGQATLSAVSGHQVQPFERREMIERRRGSDPEVLSDEIQRGSSLRCLASSNSH